MFLQQLFHLAHIYDLWRAPRSLRGCESDWATGFPPEGVGKLKKEFHPPPDM